MQRIFNYNTSSDIASITNEVAVTLDEIKAYIDQIFDVLDIDNCPVEHLNIIANLLNYPIDKEDDPTFIRRGLKNSISMYKTKGTEDCIKLLFYNLGFTVDIIPLWTPDIVENTLITPPYIQTSIINTNFPYKPGIYDVSVINPDNQLFVKLNSFEIK